MRKEFLAVFSGFPDHHFSEEITKRLREELRERKCLVFITACPLEYEQNDDDCNVRMSEDRTVYAMEDMSAFFIKGGKIDIVGKIYRVANRELHLITEDDTHELEQEMECC
ncbi:MAG: hypothetical protein K6E85_05880 [Lachnospiraceae bacterium]|nr:hypothetical protein [Lachnospiraceae bacterium]